MADPKEQKADSESAGAPAGSNKMMMGLLGLNMVVMVAVVMVLFLGQKKQASQQTLEQVAAGAAEKKEAHAPAKEGEGHGKKEGEKGKEGEGEAAGAHFFPVGDFTANLAGPASGSYVKVTVNFELSEDTDAEEMKQRKPQFRDKIISLLNSKKSADLQSSDGRNYLKEEIKTVANTFIKKGKVEGVYFSAFVIN